MVNDGDFNLSHSCYLWFIIINTNCFKNSLDPIVNMTTRHFTSFTLVWPNIELRKIVSNSNWFVTWLCVCDMKILAQADVPNNTIHMDELVAVRECTYKNYSYCICLDVKYRRKKAGSPNLVLLRCEVIHLVKSSFWIQRYKFQVNSWIVE